MSFSDTQLRQLKAPVKIQFVKEREVDGKTLHDLEGWHIIDEANRIGGFDGWDRETLSSQCVWQKQATTSIFVAAYLTRVRITVRAGDRLIQREGLGAGESWSSSPGQAHEWASKIAETDATKRALSTFGNPFGLSLYRDKTEPPKAKRLRRDPSRSSAPIDPPPTQEGSEGSGEAIEQHLEYDALDLPQADETTYDQSKGPKELDASPLSSGDASSATQEAPSSSRLNPMAEASIPVWVPSAALSKNPLGTAELQPPIQTAATSNLTPHTLPPHRIEKSALTIAEPKRIRSREHLKFVASQPCLVCARTPSQAHHLRFAQPRALGRKVSDEFTVPLCATHHHELHMWGNERDWWEEKRIEPLAVAGELWRDNRS